MQPQASNVTIIGAVGSIKTIRSSVSSNDSSNPTVGTGQDFTGYKYVECEIKLGGTTPVWSVTPLLVNAAGNTYMEGYTIVLTGAKTFVYKLEVNGNSDVNFRVDTSSGTSPTITIKARGVN